MCERKTRAGIKCDLPSAFMVHITVHPQVLGDGSTEKSPAGRMQVVCRAHVTAAVDDLAALPIVTFNAAPTVRALGSGA